MPVRDEPEELAYQTRPEVHRLSAKSQHQNLRDKKPLEGTEDK